MHINRTVADGQTLQLSKLLELLKNLHKALVSEQTAAWEQHGSSIYNPTVSEPTKRDSRAPSDAVSKSHVLLSEDPGKHAPA